MASTAPGSVAAKQILLVDGSALLYRSHFAFARNPLRNSKGEVTSAAYAFLNTLLPLLDERQPDHIAVVFDTKAPTFRHREYKEYKANRPPMPDELSRQFPIIRELLRVLGIPIVEQEGVEADDILGTLAVEAARAGAEVWILTGDKDFYQIVSEKIRLLSPPGRGGPVETVDRAAVRARFGVDPEQMIDLLALMGDSVDNVPGVPGVGEKTAAQLIATYGSLEGLYRSVDCVAKPALREKIRENEGKARLSQKLVTVRTDLPSTSTGRSSSGLRPISTSWSSSWISWSSADCASASRRIWTPSSRRSSFPSSWRPRRRVLRLPRRCVPSVLRSGSTRSCAPPRRSRRWRGS